MYVRTIYRHTQLMLGTCVYAITCTARLGAHLSPTPSGYKEAVCFMNVGQQRTPVAAVVLERPTLEVTHVFFEPA